MADLIPTNSKLALRGKVVSSPTSYVEPGRPRYPKDLSAAGKKIFKKLCKLLEQRRTLTDADGDLLRLYAITHERHARAVEHLEHEGEIVTTEHGDKQSPWLAIAERSEKSMVSILAQLGLTPATRDRIKVTKGSGKDFIEISVDAVPVAATEEPKLLTEGTNNES